MIDDFKCVNHPQKRIQFFCIDPNCPQIRAGFCPSKDCQKNHSHKNGIKSIKVQQIFKNNKIDQEEIKNIYNLFRIYKKQIQKAMDNAMQQYLQKNLYFYSINPIILASKQVIQLIQEAKNLDKNFSINMQKNLELNLKKIYAQFKKCIKNNLLSKQYIFCQQLKSQTIKITDNLIATQQGRQKEITNLQTQIKTLIKKNVEENQKQIQMNKTKLRQLTNSPLPRIILIMPSINPNKLNSIEFKIKTLNFFIGLGICIKNQIKNQSKYYNKTISNIANHGLYIISSNGYFFHSNKPAKKIKAQFKQGYTIALYIKAITNYVQFKAIIKNTFNQQEIVQQKLQIMEHWSRNNLNFCVDLADVNNSVQIIQ